VELWLASLKNLGDGFSGISLVSRLTVLVGVIGGPSVILSGQINKSMQTPAMSRMVRADVILLHSRILWLIAS
jgi:hypothetical protein